MNKIGKNAKSLLSRIRSNGGSLRIDCGVETPRRLDGRAGRARGIGSKRDVNAARKLAALGLISMTENACLSGYFSNADGSGELFVFDLTTTTI